MKSKKYKLGDIEVEGIVTPTSINLLPTKTNKPVKSLFFQLNKAFYLHQYPKVLAVLSEIEYKINANDGKYKLEIVSNLSRSMTKSNKYPLCYIDNSITEVKKKIQNMKQRMKKAKSKYDIVTYTGSYGGTQVDVAENLSYEIGNSIVILSQLKQVKEKMNYIIKFLKGDTK